MTGCHLQFYVAEKHKHQHRLTYEWLLEEARRFGLQGGCAFRALAGFGRHGRLHEEHFIELAGDLPVAVGFVLAPEEADRFLAHVADQGLDLFYLRQPVQAGFTGDAALEPGRDDNDRT